MDTVAEELHSAIETIRRLQPDATQGLPEELFLMVSALTPIPNVDLFCQNKEGQLLLSRRNDEFYGRGWHIPGGCIRFGETMLHRVAETARTELGCNVTVDPQPMAIRDVLRGPNPRQSSPNERGHNVTILFRCYLPNDYTIDNSGRTENDQGYLKWFSAIPADLLDAHSVYKDIFKENIPL